uniref:Zinc transporter ZIP9 n=1 Tax=Trichuris muris TaxID=70415 RepID=A0A5S6QYX9_TRIMR
MYTLFNILLLSACMFFASFLVGMAPTIITISEKRTKTLGAFGAGLLVGTALGIILPEGIHEIYAVHGEMHSRHVEIEKSPTTISSDVVGQQLVTRTIDAMALSSRSKRSHDKDERMEGNEVNRCEEYLHLALEGKNKLIGTALVSGFLFMLLIDFITEQGGHGTEREILQCQRHRGWVATVGLIVHSATDGIAVGAASFAHSSVTVIVFFAVLLHKAPAAFGLSVYLLNNGLEISRVRNHLIAFSSAAPLAMLLTFFFVNQTQSISGAGASSDTIGILLLLSAGSFLYVATVHILPSVPLHSQASTSLIRRWLSLELLCLFIGSAIPLLHRRGPTTNPRNGGPNAETAFHLFAFTKLVIAAASCHVNRHINTRRRVWQKIERSTLRNGRRESYGERLTKSANLVVQKSVTTSIEVPKWN